MILLARGIWSSKGDIIMNGALQISGDIIASVGSSDKMTPLDGEPVVNLGDSIIFPSFINAHCHLDYTGLAGKLVKKGSFTDWINQIVEAKRTLSAEEYESGWLLGAKMLMSSGCGTVVNIESVPGLFSRMAKQTPLQVCPFTELICFDDEGEDQIVDLAKSELENNTPLSLVAGLSPHSPYTTTPRSLSLLSSYADKVGCPITMHVGESKDEWQMFTKASGELYEKMKNMGRVMDDCNFRSPIQHVNNSQGISHQTIIVHANYLTEDDIVFLAKSDLSIVHCPYSHSWFNHSKFQYARLSHEGVNICLGTDSLASSSKSVFAASELNMFNEMREFRSNNPEVDIDDILEMATINGSRALGLDRRLGRLQEGMLANFSVIPFPSHLSDVKEAIISHKDSVGALFIAGKQVFSGKDFIAD